VHHGRFDLEEIPFGKEIPYHPDGLHRVRNIFFNLRIDGEVEVALTITDLNIREAVPLLRKRTKRLRQKLKRVDLEREFPGFRPETLPLAPMMSPMSNFLKSLKAGSPTMSFRRYA